jgi:TonB family protein
VLRMAELGCLQIVSCVLPLTSVALCAFAVAQSNVPANNSDGACTAQATAKQTLDRPDILSKPYVPPKPPPDAITRPSIINLVGARNPPHLPKDRDVETEVALLVDTDGKPRQVHVEKSFNPAFDQAVVDAIQKWQFEPATQYGKPLQVKICIAYDIPAKPH